MGQVTRITDVRASTTGQVLAHPRLIQIEDPDGQLGPALVVFPIESRVGGQEPTYTEIIMDAGRVGDEPVRSTRAAVQALTQLQPGMTVRVSGSWDVVDTELDGEPVSVERKIARSARLDGASNDVFAGQLMGEEGRGFVLAEEHFAGAGVAAGWDEPVCPMGRFDVARPSPDPDAPEGQVEIVSEVRPVVSTRDARGAAATTAMPVSLARWQADQEQQRGAVRPASDHAQGRTAEQDAALARGVNRLSLQLGAQFLPTAQGREAAAERLESMSAGGHSVARGGVDAVGKHSRTVCDRSARADGLASEQLPGMPARPGLDGPSI